MIPMVDLDAAILAIRDSRVAELEEHLIPLLEPSIRIGVMSVRGDSLPIGASRFGGLPDVPDNFAWPIFADRPMALIAQLNLAELAPFHEGSLLPRIGSLLFFFDAANDAPFEDTEDESRCWKVMHLENDSAELSRREPPAPRNAHNDFPPFALGFRSELTLPSFGSTLLDDMPIDETRRADYEELMFHLVGKPPLPAREAATRIERGLGRIRHWLIGDPVHRVLGHPEHFQLDPRVDWQRLDEHRPIVTAPDEYTERAALDWLLLLQADSFKDGPRWIMGDNATFYFGIRRDDLEARNFDAVQWTIECG